MQLTVSPVRIRGEQPLYCLAVIQGITERMQAQARVQELNCILEKRVAERTAELLAVNQELESFSYSASHDLRGPLRAINGYCLMILEDAAMQLGEEACGQLQRVIAASVRMGDLIDALLQLSRVTRAEMHAGTTDLSAMAGKSLDHLYHHEPNRLLDIHVQPDLQAWGDARLLQLVLDNLLRNAWKFSSREVRARIEFGCVEQDGERVYFVRDNGLGFDMLYAGKLFGAFQRLHGMTEFEGTGIGSATVARIINRHGGRVWAEGAVSQGAAF